MIAEIKGLMNLDGYTPYEVGHFFSAPPAQVTYYPYTYSEDLYLQGIRCHIGNNAQFGDYLTFGVVDHDNVLGYGVDFVICTMAETLYVWPGMEIVRIDSALKDIPSWLYLRHGYHSVEGATEAVECVIHHVFRRFPSA